MRFWKPDATSFEKRTGMLTWLLILLQMLYQAAFALLLIRGHHAAQAGLFVLTMMTTILICNAIFVAGQKNARMKDGK